MKKSAISILILLLFVTMVGMTANSKGALHENREPTKIPQISRKSLITPTFYSKLENYFNDNLIYRGVLIKTKSYIDYYLFNTSVSEKVYIGESGWLFYRDELPDYRKDGCNASKKMWELARQLNALERILETSGRRLIFVVAPNKSTIYPEHVGLSISDTGCNRSKYEFLLDAFREYPVKGFIRLDERLFQAKKETQLYYRHDTHWNVNGALVASNAILEHLSPMTRKKKPPDIEVINTQKSGDLERMMSIEFKTEETEVKSIHYPFKFDDDILPKTVMFRDSFMSLPLNILKVYFKELDVYGWELHISTPEAVEDLRVSQIVMFEVVERNLEQIRINAEEIDSLLSSQDEKI